MLIVFIEYAHTQNVSFILPELHKSKKIMFCLFKINMDITGYKTQEAVRETFQVYK